MTSLRYLKLKLMYTHKHIPKPNTKSLVWIPLQYVLSFIPSIFNSIQTYFHYLFHGSFSIFQFFSTMTEEQWKKSFSSMLENLILANNSINKQNKKIHINLLKTKSLNKKYKILSNNFPAYHCISHSCHAHYVIPT